MELPDDVLTTIREFSRPTTRPDWRNLHRMTLSRLHSNIAATHNRMNVPVINSFTERYDQAHYKYIFGQGPRFEPFVILQAKN